MKIFSADQVRNIDNYTIENEPIGSVNLMERAAATLTTWYVKRYKINQEGLVMVGPGNNGGDALAIARMLAACNYKVKCYLLTNGKSLSGDCAINYERLKKITTVEICEVSKAGQFPFFSGNEIIIDGLFGSGLTREVSGLFKELIEAINVSGCEVISIDVPSGLFGEDNSMNDKDAIVKASYTVTFQFPFLSFFFEENSKYTGEWNVVDIGLHKEAIAIGKSDYSSLERTFVRKLIPLRGKFAHKGNFGHALVIAGNYGMMGAALLAGKSALRGGAGLVTIHVPKSGYEIVQTAIPEAIVSIDQSEILFSKAPELEKYNAVVVGPGLGTKPNTAKGLKELLENCKVPLVLDADALNIISSDKDLLNLLPSNTILSPHPKEFDRLAGASGNGYDRHIKQREFSKKYKVIVILKGAYSGISFPDASYVFNMNGNPGMATGGSGDVLSGIIVSLLARGLTPSEASVSSVFLHGLAGDLAAEKMDQEAMIAGDIIEQLGEAFKRVKENPFLHEGRTGGVQFIAPI